MSKGDWSNYQWEQWTWWHQHWGDNIHSFGSYRKERNWQLVKIKHDDVCVLQTPDTHLYNGTSQASRSQVDTCIQIVYTLLIVLSAIQKVVGLVLSSSDLLLQQTCKFSCLHQLLKGCFSYLLHEASGAWSHCEGHWRRGGGVDGSSSLTTGQCQRGAKAFGDPWFHIYCLCHSETLEVRNPHHGYHGSQGRLAPGC